MNDIEISPRLVDVAVIIPTCDRACILKKTLETVAIQNVQPAEIYIIDASLENETEKICQETIPNLSSGIKYVKASQKGAAIQRNQGYLLTAMPFIGFMDDDVYLEKYCFERLWNCIQSDISIGGVNAMITNQKYHAPGKITGLLLRFLNGKKLSTYAGKCIGPAWNLLPEDNEALPEMVATEWLNLGLTIYRKNALPYPPFKSHFTGYSLMEDLALSLEVGKNWKLFNVRNARLYHDSQPGNHKNNVFNIAKMELLNRHYVMKHILNRTSFIFYFKLFIFQAFGLSSVLGSKQGRKDFFPALAGKFVAGFQIIFKSGNIK